MFSRSSIAVVCVLCLCRAALGDQDDGAGSFRHRPQADARGNFRGRQVERQDQNQPGLAQLQEQIRQLSKQVEKLQKTLDQQNQSRQTGSRAREWQARRDFPKRRMTQAHMMRERMMDGRMGRHGAIWRNPRFPSYPQRMNGNRGMNRPGMHAPRPMMGLGRGWMDRQRPDRFDEQPDDQPMNRHRAFPGMDRPEPREGQMNNPQPQDDQQRGPRAHRRPHGPEDSKSESDQ